MRIRLMTAMCSTRLAWRSPPRLSRWRWVSPEEAGSGATPHSIAKPASLRSRLGLSPAVTNSLPGDLHADAGGGQQLRGEFGDHRVAEADGVGKPGSAGAQQLHTGEVAGLVTQFLGRGDDVVAQ